MEVTDMIFEALRGMAIGVPGVFSVLAIFYIALKILMLKTNQQKEKEEET